MLITEKYRSYLWHGQKYSNYRNNKIWLWFVMVMVRLLLKTKHFSSGRIFEFLAAGVKGVWECGAALYQIL